MEQQHYSTLEQIITWRVKTELEARQLKEPALYLLCLKNFKNAPFYVGAVTDDAKFPEQVETLSPHVSATAPKNHAGFGTEFSHSGDPVASSPITVLIGTVAHVPGLAVPPINFKIAQTAVQYALVDYYRSLGADLPNEIFKPDKEFSQTELRKFTVSHILPAISPKPLTAPAFFASLETLHQP